MTERDSDYERWQSTLIALQEVSGQYHTVVRLIQSGLNTLSLENDALRAELIQLKREVHTMHVTFQELLPHMATIAAYVVTQRQQVPPPPSPQPQERQRQTRRPNGG